jgi:hypothetical protein
MKKPLVRAPALAAVLALLSATAIAQQRPDASAPELSIAQIISHLESQGYTAIGSIEKDEGVWKVEATSPQGVRVDLDLDPKDGRLLREKRDDDDNDDKDDDDKDETKHKS